MALKPSPAVPGQKIKMPGGDNPAKEIHMNNDTTRMSLKRQDKGKGYFKEQYFLGINEAMDFVNQLPLSAEVYHPFVSEGMVVVRYRLAA
ncbi:hypothetical protein FACS1894164_12090 [Spirochaetia bacterium]|nr:hypothetical protein FACS1894164_12090 [Spirochaetia bacterium]